MEEAAYIDAKVAAGDYAPASEVVRAGLRTLKERDQAVERWLHEDVVAAYDSLVPDPARAIPADEVRAALLARHAERAAR